MGEGAAKPSRRSTTGRLSGGHHSKPEDSNRTARRSDGLTNEEDSKRTSVRSNEDVRGAGRISDDQKIFGGRKSTLGNEKEVKPKRETQIKSKDKVKCDARSEETVLSADLRAGGEKPEVQIRLYHQSPAACQTGPDEVNSVSEGGEKAKIIDIFQEDHVATQFQEVTNRKLSYDICDNAIAREPTTIASVSSHKSLRI